MIDRDAEGRVTTCDVQGFRTLIEGYFGGTYTPVQAAEVAQWAKRHTKRVLAMVYRYCVVNEETAYGKLPTIKRLNANLDEVFETYPQLRAERVEDWPLLEEAPAGSDLEEWFGAWREATRRGENPYDSPEVREVLRKRGLET